MGIIDVTDETFENEVLKSDVPVIIDVWAPWCGPCRMYSPIIEETAKEYEGKIKFAKVNADDNQHIDEKFNIMSIPTTLLIEKGKLKAASVGAVPKNVLKKWIEENL
ncbi:MAG: thioredoxin [Candidatus Marsarchaeota archaeon]|jgi:thioredoxin 1|nr:thioredoxin [Candidatus Marsarchaeota archaeon]MCL5442464.1 thioredoxin [Candidatus Marsarchaeota archaeon]